jgi:hypothetical protein
MDWNSHIISPIVSNYKVILQVMKSWLRLPEINSPWYRWYNHLANTWAKDKQAIQEKQIYYKGHQNKIWESCVASSKISKVKIQLLGMEAWLRW